MTKKDLVDLIKLRFRPLVLARANGVDRSRRFREAAKALADDVLAELVVEAEGNKGGDYVRIAAVPMAGKTPCQLLVEVGHCGVVVLRHRMPVEAVTAALAAWDEGGRELPWSDVINGRIIAQVDPVDAVP